MMRFGVNLPGPFWVTFPIRKRARGRHHLTVRQRAQRAADNSRYGPYAYVLVSTVLVAVLIVQRYA
jgi:hypothetical protein